jgi:hypothetical protein
LKELQKLDLHGTRVTNVGMGEVAALPQLKVLHLGRTEVTAAGEATLLKAHPKLRITR